MCDSPFIVKLFETYNSPEHLYFLLELALGGGGPVFPRTVARGLAACRKPEVVYAVVVLLPCARLERKGTPEESSTPPTTSATCGATSPAPSSTWPAPWRPSSTCTGRSRGPRTSGDGRDFFDWDWSCSNGLGKTQAKHSKTDGPDVFDPALVQRNPLRVRLCVRACPFRFMYAGLFDPFS